MIDKRNGAGTSLDPRYDEFLETIPDATLIISAAGQIARANSRAEALFGYAYAGLRGQSIDVLLPVKRHPGHAELFKTFFETAELRPMGRSISLAACRQDGSEFPADIMLHPFRTDEGVFTSCIIRDVTEHKTMEAALRESERRYRLLVENASEVFYQVSAQPDPMVAQLAFVSQQTVQLTGYDQAEFMQDQSLWFRSIHPDDVDVVAKRTEEIHTSRQSGSREYRIWHSKLREYRWVEDRVVPQYDLFGNVTGHQGVARDITERKLHEEELKVVAQLSAALRQAQSRGEMPAVILGELQRLLKADAAALALRNPSTGETVIELAVGEFASGSGQRLVVGEGVTGYVMATGRPYVNNDARTDPFWSRRELLEKVDAVACVPLITQQETIGALLIGRAGTISAREVHLLSAVVEMTANALHRASLTAQAVRDAAELARAYDSTLEGWSRALDLRDKETEGHTRRVTEMTLHLAKALGLAEADLVHVRRGSLLHDIGKMGVPDSILLKPGPLNEDEWAVMRRHPTYAYEMLAPIEFLRPALDIPYCHHERWNGSGYPRGLQGKEIPLTARIFAVVDVWDAIRYDRPYRRALTCDEARAVVEEKAGTHFDPLIVAKFREIEPEMSSAS